MTSTVIQVRNVTKKHGLQVILDRVNLSVNRHQKIGVIGRNGAGKSTLLRVILGEVEPDEGDVVIHPGFNVAHLEQVPPYRLDETATEFLQRYSGRPPWQCAKLASRFRVKKEHLAAQVGELSEGFRMRVRLTGLLLRDPDFLLLDEPTNFLDVPTQILLERFLVNWRGGFLLVSHDREFLKRTCLETLEVERGRLFLYPGMIEEYLAYKVSEVARIERENAKIEDKKKHLHEFIDRFRYKASKATQAQSKLKVLERLETIEIETPLPTVRLRIDHGKIKKGIAVSTDDLTIGYGNRAVASGINVAVRRGRHAAIVGENGAGKTTFLLTLARKLEPLAGTATWGPDLEFSYYGQAAIDALAPTDTVSAHLYRSAAVGTLIEDIEAMAGNFLFSQDDRAKTVEVLSGGERARLVLAGILLSKRPVFILDEPTNHLDFETVEALATALKEYPGTVLFVSHNRTFSHLLATEVLEVSNGAVRQYPDTYGAYIRELDANAQEAERAEAEAYVPTPEELAKKQEKRDLREELETQKRLTRKIESEITRLEEERTGIHAQMALNPTVTSPTLGKRLKEVNLKIAALEEDWYAARQAIQWLERE